MDQCYCKKLKVLTGDNEEGCFHFKLDKGYLNYIETHNVSEKDRRSEQCWMCKYAVNPEKCDIPIAV